MFRDLHLVTVLLAMACGGACATDDPEIERRGGPLPPGPVVDDDATGGGNGGGVAGAGGAAPIGYCDALEVVRAKCQRCHGEPIQNDAPVAFLDFDDFHAPYYDTALKWWEVAIGMVERDTMPYVALNGSPALEGGEVLPLTTDEKATLLGWLQQGAQPEGGTDCTP